MPQGESTPDRELTLLEEPRRRLRAASVSLVVGVAVLGAKLAAYALTHSSALLSDALESIVNVVAAGFLMGSVVFADRPADRNHPYGHGKIEFFSAAFEGGLISFAAAASLIAAANALWTGQHAQSLESGLAVSGVATLANAALGFYLVRFGRRAQSIAIEADGHHVLSDVWTTVAVVLGLVVVAVTKLWWLDPVIAALVAMHLFYTGYKLVRRAAAGLLDEEDEGALDGLLQIIERERVPGLIRLHHLRSMRVGSVTHVDSHLVMPEYWTVEKAHALCDAMEQKLERAMPGVVDVVFHADPCRREHCAGCEVSDCDVRREPFQERLPITLEEAIEPDPAPRRRRSAP